VIDDIVRLIFEEARSREGHDLVSQISEVRTAVDICLDHAISVHLEQIEKRVVDSYRKA
jgi:hypothetical protein